MKKQKASRFELQPGTHMLNQKYKVKHKIGEGSFATVYSVTLNKPNKVVIRAMKVENSKVEQPQISTEVAVLRSLNIPNLEDIGFTNFYEYGLEPQFNYLVMSLLGPNLAQLLRLSGGTFSLRTTMMIGLQIVDRLRSVHGCNYLYCDIKPENFMVGLGGDSRTVFMADFGKCRRYRSKTTGQHIPYREMSYEQVNPTFVSLNVHNNIQCSRRDDIESLLYMLSYLRNGKLPWKTDETKRSRHSSLEEIKRMVTPEVLYSKFPFEMIDVLYYTKTLQFYEKPDYDYIQNQFRRCINKEDPLIFDWNLLKDIDFDVYSGEPKIVVWKEQEKLEEGDNVMHVDNIFGINIEVEEDNETCHFHEGLEKEENPLLLK